MPDDLRIKAPEDKRYINVNQPYEMNYWVKALGVSADRIRRAVKAVGPLVTKVKKYLSK